MLNFDTEINAFENAAYGEDVRQALIDIAEAVEDQVNDALENQLLTVDDTLTESGAGADAKTVGDLLYGGTDHSNRAVTPSVHYRGDITHLLDLPIDSWKLIAAGATDTPDAGTLRAMLGDEFPWKDVLGESDTMYHVSRRKTFVTGGSQFVIEALRGNPRFYGVAAATVSTDAGIEWRNRSITSDLTITGAAAEAAIVGTRLGTITDLIYGTRDHVTNNPRVLTQFFGVNTDGLTIADIPDWSVCWIYGSRFLELFNAGGAFPFASEIYNNSTIYYLEKAFYNVDGQMTRTYTLYRLPRTTVYAGYSGRGATQIAANITWNRVIAPGGVAADGNAPNYVSIGASTTYGAVKHTDGTTTQSPNRYPVYVANALHMTLADKSVGTTGFMYRGDNGDRQNFMDVIADGDNASIFANAGLITIMFGYGNDGKCANADDTAVGLPIGLYTDYFPFDPENYSDGTAGVAEMLADGATLFGCLNWCIKYLGENFPNAQILPVFAAPSQNKWRTVTVTNRTPDDASPSKKTLVIADPYVSTATDKEQKAVYAISQQLPLLRGALSIPIIDTYNDTGNAFSYYQTVARTNGVDYDVFSETGSALSPTWDRHPNDDGYALWSRYIAGLITRQFYH